MTTLTQNELKILVAQKAIQYVPANAIIGVGTGSTADLFIDELVILFPTWQHTTGSGFL